LALFGGGAFVAVVLLWFGIRFLAGGVSGPTVVIPENDRKLLEQLIRDGNEKGIDQHVRLSSLGGATGTATQLGLTGLPLATIGLTVFFSVVAIMNVDGFLDLAKLTLGAFIGSFVQRNVSGERVATPPKDQPP
jgi:putative aminopeptidase FrvX